MAAAARHTIPAGVAPPRSTRSARLTRQPMYSAMVAGTKNEDSKMSLPHTRPSTSWLSIPASCSAAAAMSAHCSRVSFGVPVNRRSERCCA